MHDTLEEALNRLKGARLAAEQSTDDTRAQRELSTALQGVGDIQLQRGEFNLALQAYSESLEIQRALVETEPGELGRKILLPVLQRLGDVLEKMGRYNEALSCYLEALEVVQHLIDSGTDEVATGLSELKSDLQEQIQSTRVQTVADSRL